MAIPSNCCNKKGTWVWMPKQAWKLLPPRSCDVFSGMIKQQSRNSMWYTQNSLTPALILTAVPQIWPASWQSEVANPDTTETPGLKLYRKTSTMSLELLKFVQGISDFLTIWQSKAKAIHFARRPGLDLEWGHLSESFAADRSIETSVTLTFMVVRHSSLHLPKCQCTPNKGSVNCCHSSAQIVNL